MEWSRFAIYWAPHGDLGALGAAWLGWDLRRSAVVMHDPSVEAPGARRYGFHATLKPPFRLAPGHAPDELAAAARDLFAGLAPVDLGRLEVTTLGTFCALRPTVETGIAGIAAAAVTGLDAFRAPATEAERARRRAAGLTPAQEALLERWGYPFVLDEFRPHVTLSDAGATDDLVASARRHFAPDARRCTLLDRVSLVGEDAAGRFNLIEDLPLGGHAGAAASRAESAASTAR